MVIKKYLGLLIIALLFKASAFSQIMGVGPSVIYNLQTESVGFGIRAEVPFTKFSVIPQFAYFPSFNKVNELYAGISLHLNVFTLDNLVAYGIANGSFNGWINHQGSAKEGAKFSNWGGEVGVGVTTKKWFRPFFEYRYNIRWQEANVRVGFVYFFKLRNKHICATYI